MRMLKSAPSAFIRLLVLVAFCLYTISPSFVFAARCFTPGTSIGTNAGPSTTLILGDFNNDGSLDFLEPIDGFCLQPGGQLFLNDGSGSFHEVDIPSIPHGSYPFVSVADFNQDTVLDLAVTTNSSCFDQPGLRIFLGNGDGTFQSPQVYQITPTWSPKESAVADFNLDGHLDVIVSDGSSPNFYLFLGNGDGTFQPGRAVSAQSANGSPKAADLNHDGIPDLMYLSTNGLSVKLGNGDGTFQPPTRYRISGFYSTQDLNADGNLDVVVTHFDVVHTYLGNGDGTLRPGFTFNAPTAWTAVEGNLGTDGFPELVVTDRHFAQLKVFRGKGDGSFGNPQTYSMPSTAFDAAIGDINNDGLPDIVTNSTPQQGGAGASILLNTGQCH